MADGSDAPPRPLGLLVLLCVQRNMRTTELCVATFNVRGLTCNIKQHQLAEDLKKYNIDIACIQETKIQNGVDINVGDCRLITFETQNKYYGLGFAINKQWCDSIHRTWKVNDRISVLQLISTDRKIITIVNVYGPTSTKTTQDRGEIDHLYDELSNLAARFRNKTTLVVCGDFNAKVGKKCEESCIGNYSKGQRNNNGQCLVDFCTENGLFITNTSFMQRAKNITTWTGQWKNKKTGEIVPIYNQIDYIICESKFKKFLTNSRSYSGTLTFSDHRIVIAKFNIEWRRVWQTNYKENNFNRKFSTDRLINDKQIQADYTAVLKDRIENEEKPIRWEKLSLIIKESAINTVGHEEKRNRTPNRTYDKQIADLSQQQKTIKTALETCKEPEKRQDLKKRRNAIINKIHKHVKDKRNRELDQKAEEINNAPDHTQMFRAVRTLNRQQYENPKIFDEDGKYATNEKDIQTIILQHFKSKFRSKDTNDVQPFEGGPRNLNKPITTKEVSDALGKLNNNKACGEDGIPAELLKYGGNAISGTLATILNNIFVDHDNININGGLIIALQKPGKEKGPVKNLRPITLLNTIRKLLSLIVLGRINKAVDAYLDPSQCGFRNNRSTSDIVWSHKWLISKTYAEDVEIFITGIDMTSAFDTIDRHLLLQILSSFLQEDEIRIIRYLLSSTDLKVKLKTSSSESFVSNIGTPQGDGLSPVLFTIYLEHALRDLRKPHHSHIPYELTYADDVDFVSITGFQEISTVQKHLIKSNLQVNESKTEFTTISRSDDSWRKVKKVGSLLGDSEDVCRRKQLSNAALYKLKNIWLRNDKVKRNTRIKLYRSVVKSVLTYNCETWALTKQDQRKLDAFHRRQLRQVLNITYPKLIKNKSLYRITQEKPISLTILERRWRLFGHILRQDIHSPANQAMLAYFKQEKPKRRGRQKTSIVSTLRHDLKTISNSASLKLKTITDLEELRHIARNRKEWKFITAMIHKAAQVEKSEDYSTEGL